MIVLGCSWAPWDWGDCVSEFLGSALQAATGGLFKIVFDIIAQIVSEAVRIVLEAVGTLWIDIDTPSFESSGTVFWVQNHTGWILVLVGTISVIIAGIRMAVSQRGEPVRDLLRSLFTMVIVSLMGVAFASTLIELADWFSQWLINAALRANGSGFSDVLTQQFMNPLKTEFIGVMLVIFIGILMVITSLVQLALMVVRYGMLILLVGVLPLTAAATNTEMGMLWFKRSVAWLAGFILYKPVAAIIYASAITLIGGVGGDDSRLKAITGIALMMLAVVALPAILRFVSPRTGG